MYFLARIFFFVVPVFVDPSTLDLDFFSQASAKQSAPSKLARQSLFRVFDPLVGQLLSPDVRPPAMAENQRLVTET